MFSTNFNLKATKIALLQSKSHRITKHRLLAALKPFQLRPVDWTILGFLGHKKKPMSISEVATELGIQSSFMTIIVTKLEKRNLIIVTDDETDRRKKYIALAAEGQKVIKLMQRQFEEFFAPLIQGLSGKELAAYIKVLDTVIKNAEQNNILRRKERFQ